MISNTRKALLGLSAVAAITAFAAPAEAQWRHGGYYRGGYHGGWHRGGGWGYGGAAAAGVVGGLALGALAAPAYGYGAPAYGYGGYGGCYIERQQVYDAWGRPFIRRVRVCN